MDIGTRTMIGPRVYDEGGGFGAAPAGERPPEGVPAPPEGGAPATPSASQSNGHDAAGGGLGSVDQIRDIIFGVQMREYDTRFSRLEQRLLQESAALREDTTRRFDALEAFVKQQFQALGDRLSHEMSTEQQARGADVQALTQRLGELTHHVEQRTAQIDQQASHNLQTLQQQLHEQSQTLTTDLRTRFDDLSATLDRQTTALRDEKTDRASLAGLLTELARRLHPESANGTA